MFEFIAHDKWCSKPDEVDRDVRHGQVTQDHDDDDDVCMYVCWCRVGCLKLQSSTWRRANALAHDDGTFTCHFGVTYVDYT